VSKGPLLPQVFYTAKKSKRQRREKPSMLRKLWRGVHECPESFWEGEAMFVNNTNTLIIKSDITKNKVNKQNELEVCKNFLILFYT
jgi:hypothetical protein